MRAAGASAEVVRLFVSIRFADLRRHELPIGCPCGEARPIESVEPSSWQLAPGCERRCRACSQACSVGRRSVRTTKSARRALHEVARCRCTPPQTIARIGSLLHGPTRRRARASRRERARGGEFSSKRNQSLPPLWEPATNPKFRRDDDRGETNGVGCRIVGEKSVQFGARFHPRRSWGERRPFWVYSKADAGFSTLSGKPGIASAKRRPSPSKPGDCSRARPTKRRL